MSAHAPTTYVAGKAVDPRAEHPHHHVHPISHYLKVFGALMVLTVLTVAVSYADLGTASIGVAMVVAVVKAALVLAFFMHLAQDDKFYTFIFLCTLIFVAIFFLFTFSDLATRGATSPEWGVKGWMEQHGETIVRTAPAEGAQH